MLALLPEQEFVLLAARPTLDSEARGRLDELIESGIDWAALIETAHRQGVLPVVAASLRRFPALPPRIARELADASRTITARNLHMTQELLTVLGALERSGVKAATFKGAVLAAELYGNIALRQFTDIDVLVDASESYRAVDVLTRRGYQPFDATTVREIAALVAASGNVPLWHPRLGIRLEVHTHLLEPHRRLGLTAAAALRRSRCIPIGGTAVPTLAIADLALYLCVHGAKHEWERLEWLSDLARLIEVKSGIDWTEIIQDARRLGQERAVLLGLALCESLLRTSLPPEIRLEHPTGRTISKLVSQAERALFEPETPPWSFRSISFRTARLSDKARQVLFRLFSPQLADLRAVSLAPRLNFLYYAIRPLRLALARLRPIAARPRRNRLRAA